MAKVQGVMRYDAGILANLAASPHIADILVQMSIHDLETHWHMLNVASISASISSYLKLERTVVETIAATAMLHDIGKLDISGEILRAPRQLTPEEWVEMRRHPEYGAALVRGISELHLSDTVTARYNRLGPSGYPLGLRSTDVALAPQVVSVADAIAAHHERLDGSGYPHGLRASQIPLAAQVVAVADSYDTMRFRRSYKEPREAHVVLTELVEDQGRLFDRELIAALVAVVDDDHRHASRMHALRA
jgi:HD-GYP domain-containing protein (c-di-GMP phosphodiesterase class II)